METFLDIFRNPLVVCAALGWASAQITKTIIHLIVTGRFVPERLVGNGGMPSSHAATVCALATATGMKYGVSGFEFPMAAFFAVIVMIDAMGVRLETGKQAMMLNDMVEMFKSMGKWKPGHGIEHLKEFVGHTPLQILVGGVMGIVIAVISCNLMA